MANEFKIRKGLIVEGASGGTVVDVLGSQGQLLSVTDDLSGSIFAVSDISGVPIFDVNSSGLSTFDGNVNLPDSKKILLGTGNDLEIYHTGNQSYIKDSGTGSLIIESSDLFLRTNSTENAIVCAANASVTLYHNNIAKLATTSTGVSVTGNATVGTGVINGSIGSDIAITQGAIGIRINDAASAISPTTATANNDNAIDLGVSNIRFKDLYLGGNATAATFLGDLNGTINTVTTAVTKPNATDDNTVATTAYVVNKIAELPAGLIFLGTWNADTNDPSLASGGGERSEGTTTTVTANKLIDSAATFTTAPAVVVGDRVRVVTPAGPEFALVTSVDSATQLTLAADIVTAIGEAYILEVSPFIPEGNYYIVSDNGATDLNGITDWKVGDWVVASSTNVWQKIDNSSVLDGSGTGQTIPLWSGSGDSNTLANSILTQSSGSIITQTATSVAEYTLNSIASNDIVINFDQASTQRAKIGYDNSEGALAFVHGTGNFSTAGMVLNATGVGIGLTSPQANLDITGTSTNDRGLQIRCGDVSNQSDSVQIILSYAGNSYNSSGYAHSIRTRHFSSVATDNAIDFFLWTPADTASTLGTKRVMTLDGSGNVGIGTASPDALLEISGNAGADPGPITNPTTFRITDSGNAAAGSGDTTNPWGKIEFYSEDLSSGGPSVQTQIASIYDNVYSYASSLTFSTRLQANTSLLERMRINPAGNVGIGTVSPGALLQVGGTTNSNGSPGSFNIAGSYGVDSWARAYVVSNTNILPILQANNTALQNGGAYRVTGHIDGTGTDQSSRAVFWNQNGTWQCNLTSASGTSSNNILFLIDSTTGLPSVKTYHANNYTVRVWHERINLNEGTGTDNTRHYFGTDSYMTQINQDISMFTSYSGNNTNGKLGIGTASPNAKLEVASGQAKTVTSGVQFARFGTSNEASNYATLTCEVKGAAAAANRKWIFQTIENGVANAGNIVFQPSGGNVGIGTESPAQDFVVATATNGIGIELVPGNLSYIQVYNRGTSDYSNLKIDAETIAFGTDNGALRMIIDSDGNVGINATSNSAEDTNNGVPKLQVNTAPVLGGFPLAARFTTGSDAGDNSGVSVLINSGNDRGLMISAGREVSNVAKVTLNVVDNNGDEIDTMTFLQAGQSGATANVGIGTSTPNAKLDVQGTQGQLFSVTDDLSGSIFAVADISGVPIFDVNSSGVSYFDGNVGIGTTSPGTFLQLGTYAVTGKYINQATYPDIPSEHMVHIAAPSTFSYYGGGISFGETAFTAANIVVRDAGGSGALDLCFGTGTASGVTEKMRIANNGNVGIGTNNPGSYRLNVAGTMNVATSAGAAWLAFLNNTSVSGHGLLIQAGGTTGTRYITQWKDYAGTERFHMEDNGEAYFQGKVGIGVTGPLAKLQVGATVSSGATGLSVSSAAGQGNLICLGGTNHNWLPFTNGQNYYSSDIHNFRSASHSVVFMVLNSTSLTVSGDVVAYGSPSDVRLKENIKPIESALDKVSKLQGVTFDWKEKGITNLKKDIGFIAQDVQKVIPELVRENEDGMLSMRHQGIAPILLEAIKELKAEIEELKLNKCNCNK